MAGLNTIFEKDRSLNILVKNDFGEFEDRGISVFFTKHVQGASAKKLGKMDPVSLKIQFILTDDKTLITGIGSVITKVDKLIALKEAIDGVKVLKLDHVLFQELSLQECICEYYDFELKKEFFTVNLDLVQPKTSEEKQNSKDSSKPELKSASKSLDTIDALNDSSDSSNEHRSFLVDLLDKIDSIIEKVYE